MLNKKEIINKVHSIVGGELRDVPFDKALPKLRKVLWDIADEIGADGADVLAIYMDWLSEQK